MNSNSYLYFIDNSYILFDHQSMTFYTIPNKIGEKISALEDDAKSAILENVLASKRTGSCVVTEEPNRKKCKRLILLLAQKCNLACRYCYGESGTYGDKCGNIMSAGTARNAIDRMVKKSPDGIGLIQFFGGEPLLNYKVIEDICEYCIELTNNGKLKECPKFVIVTNGTIMNEAIRDLFNKYNISVTISLDGPEKVNDRQRVYAGSDSSVYKKIMETIDFLNEDRNFLLSVEITMTQYFIDLPDQEKCTFFDYLICKCIDSVHVVPVITPNNTDLYIKDDEKLKSCMDLITDYSFNSITTNNPLLLVKIGDFFSIIKSKVEKQHFCSAGISNFAIDTQGDIYGCFMFINSERKMCMGNVNNADEDTFEWDNIRKEFEEATINSCEECKDCHLRGLCSNCVAASYLQYGKLNKPIPQQCTVQHAMFNRIGYHIANNNTIKKQIG